MKYTIQLNTGNQIHFESEDFNADLLAEKFNTNEILVTAIGDALISKNSIVSLVPEFEGEYSYMYELTITHGQKILIPTNELLNIQAYPELMNNQLYNFFSIGGVLLQKYIFNSLVLIKKEESLVEE